MWITTGRIGWEESREEVDRNREDDINFILCSICRVEWREPRGPRDNSSPTGEREWDGAKCVFLGKHKKPSLIPEQ